MTTITFDTHEYIKSLTAAGVSEQQAEAFARVQKTSLSEIMDNSLATKKDLQECLEPLKNRIIDVEKEILVMRWMLGVVIALNVAILVRLFIK